MGGPAHNLDLLVPLLRVEVSKPLQGLGCGLHARAACHPSLLRSLFGTRRKDPVDNPTIRAYRVLMDMAARSAWLVRLAFSAQPKQNFASTHVHVLSFVQAMKESMRCPYPRSTRAASCGCFVTNKPVGVLTKLLCAVSERRLSSHCGIFSRESLIGHNRSIDIPVHSGRSPV